MRAIARYRLAIAAALVLLAPGRVPAQSSGVTLPGSTSQTCVQVEVPGEKPSVYNCLNQQLQQEALGAGRPQANAPLTATSPSNQVGTFNEQGVAEQYGQNFGKSVIPFRPPPPVFNNAIGPVH
jgi:hypothetical protein